MPEIKKSDDLKKTPSNVKPETKSKRKLWWIIGGVGGGCCLLVLILLILFGLLPFISVFRSTADVNIPSFNPSSKTSASPSQAATPTPTSQNQSQSVPGQCEHLQLVDSVPINISADDPGLKQDTDTHYYQVYGTTPYEVRAQLNECGAKSAGEGYDAYTSYHINWVYHYRSIAGGCAVYDVAVGAKIDFFYPKWEDPGNAETGLPENWQRYMTNLITHEEGHKDIALTGAQAIYDTLSTLPTFSNCDEAQNTANSTGQDIFDEYDARQEAYDAETNHGATQGAVFP